MQQKEQTGATGQDASSQSNGEAKMALNPNPRANENTKSTSFDKTGESDAADAVGSEITDGEAS